MNLPTIEDMRTFLYNLESHCRMLKITYLRWSKDQIGPSWDFTLNSNKSYFELEDAERDRYGREQGYIAYRVGEKLDFYLSRNPDWADFFQSWRFARIHYLCWKDKECNFKSLVDIIPLQF